MVLLEYGKVDKALKKVQWDDSNHCAFFGFNRCYGKGRKMGIYQNLHHTLSGTKSGSQAPTCSITSMYTEERMVMTAIIIFKK